MTDRVSKVTVELKGLSWTKFGPADADIMLVAPDGKTSVMLMSDACETDNGRNPIPPPGIDLTFDDAAPKALPTDGCTKGTYRPTNVSTPEFSQFHSPAAFPAPAPRRADSNSLGHFAGVEHGSVWALTATQN